MFTLSYKKLFSYICPPSQDMSKSMKDKRSTKRLPTPSKGMSKANNKGKC